MTNQDTLEHRLKVAVESNEKYRSRARAVSTLCAAAAGALIAGLIFVPADIVPQSALVLGLVAITFLTAATGFTVAASSTSSYEENGSRLVRYLHAIEVWRVRTKPPEKTNPREHYKRLEENALAIQRRIIRIMGLGLWCATLAALFLIASLIVTTLLRDSSRTVTIDLVEPLQLPSCPGLGQTFEGQVRDRDRASNSTLLPVTVSATECKNRSGAVLIFDKTVAVILDEHP